jgi:hypothetical protein
MTTLHNDRFYARFGLVCSLGASALALVLLSGAVTLARAAETTLLASEKPTAAQLDVWRQKLTETRRDKKACYTASYPDVVWHEAPCKPKTTKLFPPRRTRAILPSIVGAGNFDFVAGVTGHISVAQGSFDPSGTVVGSECSVPCSTSTDTCAANLTCNSPGAVANSFSLQLNTQFLVNAEICKTAPTPGSWGSCQGWEQFVYESDGAGDIQYWLAPYGPMGSTCPSGFSPFQYAPTATDPNPPLDCFDIAGDSAPVNAAVATALPQIVVTGAVAGVSGPTDTITVFVNGQGGSGPGDDLFTDLGQIWNQAEFNVFGDGNNAQAVFSSGSTVIPRVGATSGATSGPTCEFTSFTGETNNLTLGNVPPAGTQLTAASGTTKMPALIFQENNPALPGSPASCADAVSVGDTHLTTFDGLKYDFQATGDFLLAENGTFRVQTRQGLSNTDPGWIQNAALNKAVGVQMGASRVALYIWPVRFTIDGKTTDLAEGKTIALADGALATLRGGVYIIADSDGDIVRITPNNNNINTWIDVSVGLGRTPAPNAHGLLGSPGGNAHDLLTADGAALKTVSFGDLYQRFADGWRVKPEQSILDPDPSIKVGVPAKPFVAEDLDAETEQKARAACLATGLVAGSALDDCTLDVGVLGDGTAASVFRRTPAPRSVLPKLKL